MKTICYIPLDNRPVCLKRVKLLMNAINMNYLIPNEKLIATLLDHDQTSSHGNPPKILEWFKNLNHEMIDYYIISIDQIVSGGLVNSRNDLTTSFNKGKDLIDGFFSFISKDKPVFIIDSIVRLASTVGYNGYVLKDYLEIREYAKVTRLLLKDNELNINNICDNYEVDENSNKIDYTKYGLTSKTLNEYLTNRKRKLLITDYLINKTLDYNVYYMLGIDDSNAKVTIQTNEINYFIKRIDKNKGLVFVGIDELGLMAVMRIARLTYTGKTESNIKVLYLGNNESRIADDFDIGTIEECVDAHLDVMKLNKVNENKSQKVINFIVMTYNTNDENEINEAIKETIETIKDKMANHELIILADASRNKVRCCLEKAIIEQIDLASLLAYSNWNTVANTIGIALSQAYARSYYLSYEKGTKLSNEAYLELMTYSYLKDICYKSFGQHLIKKEIDEITKDPEAHLNFYKYKEMLELKTITINALEESNNNPASAKIIINNLLKGFLLVKLGKKQEYQKIKDLVITGYNYPWYRIFELDIKIKVQLED